MSDGRGINELIRDDLATRGVTVTTGRESARPTPVDTIVTYEDRWMWDVTMYMLSLTISFRDGTTIRCSRPANPTGRPSCGKNPAK